MSQIERKILNGNWKIYLATLTRTVFCLSGGMTLSSKVILFTWQPTHGTFLPV